MKEKNKGKKFTGTDLGIIFSIIGIIASIILIVLNFINDESKTIDDEIEVPVQINGKVKAVVKVPLNSEEEIVKNIVHSNDDIKNNNNEM